MSLRAAPGAAGWPVMCGSYHLPGGASLTLQTPYHPARYTSNFRCRWTVTVSTCLLLPQGHPGLVVGDDGLVVGEGGLMVGDVFLVVGDGGLMVG